MPAEALGLIMQSPLMLASLVVINHFLACSQNELGIN